MAALLSMAAVDLFLVDPAISMEPLVRAASVMDHSLLDSIAVVLNGAVWSSAEFPARLVALPEGVLRSFNDEIMEHRGDPVMNGNVAEPYALPA